MPSHRVTPPTSRPKPVTRVSAKPGSFDVANGNVNESVTRNEKSHENTDPWKARGKERLKSPNVENWDPDTRLLQSSEKWIAAYGLKKLKLELEQILPTIGFKHSDDFVESLKKPISARYSKGLFTKYPYKDGTVYNLVATRDKLKVIEKQLLQAINLYKKRLDWLTTESRRIFGVIEEKCISIVLDVQSENEAEFDMYIQSLIQAIKEQIMFISKLNLIRVAEDADCWQENVTNITLESVDSALDWVLEQPMKTNHSPSSTTEALLKAMSDDDVEAVYLFTEGNSSCSSKELLKRKISFPRCIGAIDEIIASCDAKMLTANKLKECGKQLNVVSFNCKDHETFTFLKSLSQIGGGRFHTFSIFEESGSYQYEESLTKGDVGSGFSPNGKQKGKSVNSIGHGVRDDVMKIWEELDTARNTLKEIQALLVEFENPQKAKQALAKRQIPKREAMERSGRGELYMSSKQWLARHGLKAKKIGFYDFLQTLAFKHCDGVVDIQHPPKGDVGNAVVKQKLVNAKYCDRFAHVRWKDGELMHVHVNGPMHRSYEERVLAAVESYQKRMEWLQQGSRELFGTIIEDQVALLIDTSSSIASRLFLIKDKLYRLMQEQLKHKRKFNIIKFDSRVQPWRDHLVDCNSHNLENAWQWVKGLSTGGSTNTLGALKRALADSQVQAVYLLTDGRPDQPPATVLAQSALINTVPIHTISFNCADSEANEFLAKLAEDTGGRFHYFSEDGYDSKGPKPYESEDLRLLREEIEKGLSDLQKVNRLRDECNRLDWQSSEKEKPYRTGTSSSSSLGRPVSAVSRSPTEYTPMPVTSSKRPRPVTAKSRTYTPSNSSTSNGLIPSPPVAANRASQLRQNASRVTNGDWMLRETREYLERGSSAHTSKHPITSSKKKRKPRSRSPASSMKRWLKKNNLAARKLTILDALAPTMIPHTTKYVPILDKHVLSKVFDQVLPLAHTSGRDREAVQIINPQAANLKSYEEKLEKMIDLYKRKLDEFVFPVLSSGERLKYSGEGVPSFLENRESMMDDLEKSGWPLSKEEVEKYEQEIKQAEIYLSQSKELQETAEKLSREALQKQKELRGDSLKLSGTENKENSSDRPVTTKLTSSTNRHLRHQRIIGRSALDGFYYPGVVSRCLNSRYLEVDFDNGDRQVTSVRYVIPIGGARPCPTLKVGDYVFVKSKLPTEIDDDIVPEFDYCYVPGIVQVTPLRHRSASKCYTVLRHNGSKVTVLRNDLIKTTRSRFIFACRFIRDAELAAHKGTSPVVRYPAEEEKPEVEESKNDDIPSRASSAASSHQSSATSRSSHSSKTGSSRSSKKSSKGSGRDSQGSSPRKSHGSSTSSSSSQSSSKNTSPVVTPEGTPRSQSPIPIEQSDHSPEMEERMKSMLEEFKKSMEEEYLQKMSDLDEKKKKLDELHDELLKQREDQRKSQGNIEEEQRKLQEKHQELMQRQLDQQHENQKRLIEDQSRLHQQQEELLRKQKAQHEELLQSQLNQSRSLNLQYLRLANKRPMNVKDQEIETENNSIDQETETENNNEDKHTETERSDSKDSQTSPMQSRRNSNANDEEASEDAVDNAPSHGGGDKDENEEETPTEVKMFVREGSEAVLITKGDRGLLLSRQPSEVDPAVVAQDLPRPIAEGEEVLARWSDDGWYYRGTIKDDCGKAIYAVEDTVGNVEKIVRDDIITDEDDADNIINAGDTVVALHPRFPYSYAPGVVWQKRDDSDMRVRFYDEEEAKVAREEMYLLSNEKFERACAYIFACEDGLVGQAVIARNDADGMFYLGSVRERVSGPRNYLIEWADKKLQIQNYSFIFGAHTKRHELSAGDSVLAISDINSFTYLPGKVTSVDEKKLTVEFCNGEKIGDVDPLQTFWISSDYYGLVSDFYLKPNTSPEAEVKRSEEPEAS